MTDEKLREWERLAKDAVDLHYAWQAIAAILRDACAEIRRLRGPTFRDFVKRAGKPRTSMLATARSCPKDYA